MQKLRSELDSARATRAGATDLRAQDALDGVITALNWAIEDVGRTPTEIAADYRTAKAAPAKAPTKRKVK